MPVSIGSYDPMAPESSRHAVLRSWMHKWGKERTLRSLDTEIARNRSEPIDIRFQRAFENFIVQDQEWVRRQNPYEGISQEAATNRLMAVERDLMQSEQKLKSLDFQRKEPAGSHHGLGGPSWNGPYNFERRHRDELLEEQRELRKLTPVRAIY